MKKHDGCKNLIIHVFDQGRRGVGGRTSSRLVRNKDNDDTIMRWDHGCQFFRADTLQFKHIMKEWMDKDFVREWKGRFVSSKDLPVEKEFFGLPSTPPFYVAVDGMQSLANNILDDVSSNLSTLSSSSSIATTTNLEVFTGTRVAQLERNDKTNKWMLHGVSGISAYHDTPTEKIAKANSTPNIIGEDSGYDAIILTDVSSSFGAWHRASAGVPEEFAKRVRERVGSRVPLFSAMIAFETKTDIPFDAASFDDSTVWFASKSNSKPGMDNVQKECWTIVSTPEYAMSKIEETPMQDPITGEFIPQSKDYLSTVPGPELYNAFEALICQEDGCGILGKDALDIKTLPKVVYMDAQRWGSAMPSHRHLDMNSSTRRVISGVP